MQFYLKVSIAQLPTQLTHGNLLSEPRDKQVQL